MKKFSDFNPETDLHYGEYNNKFISPRGDPPQVQIPRLYMPFGLSGFEPNFGAKKWNIDFALKGWDEEDSQANKFYKWIKRVEDTVLEHVSSISKDIFNGKEMSVEELRGMFNSNLKEADSRYEPKFRVKVETYPDGNIKAPIFDENDAPASGPERHAEDKMYARESAIAIIEPGSVYFMNKKLGIVWKLVQMKHYAPQRLKGFHFQIKE